MSDVAAEFGEPETECKHLYHANTIIQGMELTLSEQMIPDAVRQYAHNHGYDGNNPLILNDFLYEMLGEHADEIGVNERLF